jgi:putative redox protein
VEIEAERASGIPAVFTKIHLHFIVSGKDIDPDKVRKAVDLSADKYCSASKMLEKAAEISHDFEVVNLD